MAMLTYPCMEESCVCTVPASRSIVPLRYVQCWSQLSSYQKKNKTKKKQAPTVNSSILLTLFQMNKWLFTRWKSFEAVWQIGRRNGMQKEVGKENKNTPQCQIVQEREEKCAIFICPSRETTVATIPAVGFIQEDKLNCFPVLRSQLRFLT